MQRNGYSDTDLLAAVRSAASEAPSAPQSRHSRGSSRPRLSGGSRLSRSASTMGGSSAGGPLCMTLEENQRHVQDAAMNRYVASLERDAKEVLSTSQRWKTSVQGGMDEESSEKRRRRLLAEQNQALLVEQMESNKARRADNRREYIHAASSHSFPLFTETFIDEEEYERIRKRQKELWREELDEQMVTNAMLRNIEEKKVRELAHKKHRENLHNMTRDRGLEYERLANQGREMVSSWERDIRLKSLKKAMETGRDVTKEVTGHSRTGTSHSRS